MRHPLFARLYLGSSRRADARGGAEHRRRLLAGLTGRVVEVGAGAGASFVHYPDTVTKVLAIEPEPFLRRQALRAADTAPVPVQVLDGTAESLPMADGTADAGVVSLVLCSVDDQAAALAELRRAIRQRGELRFYEHVAAGRGVLRGIQRLADATIWPRLAGNCHAARDTGAAIAGAGFAIERCERFDFSPGPPLPAVPHVLGVARRV